MSNKIKQEYVNGYMISSIIRPEYIAGYSQDKYECMVFPVDENNEVTDWGDLEEERTNSEVELMNIHDKMVEKYKKK